MIRSFQPSEVSRPSATSRAVDPYARKTRAAYETLSFSAVVLEMCLAVVIGLLFGRWLDGKAGTSPWLMIVFLLIGFAAGLKGVLRAVAKADRIAAQNEAVAAAEASTAADSWAAAASATVATPPVAEIPPLTSALRGRS